MADDADHEHRVVAGLLRRLGRVLLCHRTPQRRWYPDTWDLPGGHIEGHEQPAQALVRELREELGVDIMPSEPRIPDLGEHDALAWVDVPQAQELPLADPRLLRLIETVLE